MDEKTIGEVSPNFTDEFYSPRQQNGFDIEQAVEARQASWNKYLSFRIDHPDTTFVTACHAQDVEGKFVFSDDDLENIDTMLIREETDRLPNVTHAVTQNNKNTVLNVPSKAKDFRMQEPIPEPIRVKSNQSPATKPSQQNRPITFSPTVFSNRNRYEVQRRAVKGRNRR